MNATTTRPASDNQLLIHSLTPSQRSPLQPLIRRVAECGCNLVDVRVATLGADASVALLAQGSWDAIAKLETALAKLDRDGSLKLGWYRTAPREEQNHLLPYMVEVVAADKGGILVEVIDFFTHRGISVEQLSSMRYQAMQTGAQMFTAQCTIGIPSDSHIATLRDDFMELCDGLNLDAIMDPVKF